MSRLLPAIAHAMVSSCLHSPDSLCNSASLNRVTARGRGDVAGSSHSQER